MALTRDEIQNYIFLMRNYPSSAEKELEKLSHSELLQLSEGIMTSSYYPSETEVVRKVLDAIRFTSQGVEELPEVAYLHGISSLPAIKDKKKVVNVPLSLLGEGGGNGMPGGGFFNAAQFWPDDVPDSLEEVLARIMADSSLREEFAVDGMVITFRNSSGIWSQWQYSEPFDKQISDFENLSNWTQIGVIPDSVGGGCVYPERYSNDFYRGLLIALEIARTQERTIIDCTYFTGEYVFPDTIVVDFPINIRFGSCIVTTHGENFFDIRSNNVRIEGANRQTDRYVTDKNATTFVMEAKFSATNDSTTGYHIYSRGNKNCQYRDLVLRGAQTSIGRQVGSKSYPIDGCGGIFIEKADPAITASGNTCNATVIDNVLIDGTKGAAIYIDTPILAMLRNIRVSSAGGHGIFIKDGTSTVLESCYVASARYAGFCISGLTYGAVINSVAEVCGCGWWIRSCTNVSFFSPGVESTYNYGFNPWKKSYTETQRYGMGMTTKAADGNIVKINDVPNESWTMGERTIKACDLFIGYAFVVTGGRNVNIFTPYCINIANELTPTNPQLASVAEALCVMVIMGNNSGCRGLTVTNALFQERAGSKVSEVIRNEIRISKDVHNLDLSYNPETSVIKDYTAPGPVTSDATLTAPILNLSATTVVHCGNRYFSKMTFSDVDIRGAASITGQIVTDTGILSKGPIIDFKNAELRLTTVWEPVLSDTESSPTEELYEYSGQSVRVTCSAQLGLDITTENTFFELLVNDVVKTFSQGNGELAIVLMSEGIHVLQLKATYEDKTAYSEKRFLRIIPNEALPIRFISTEAVKWLPDEKKVLLRLNFTGAISSLTQIGIVYSPSNTAPTVSQNALYYGSGAATLGAINDYLTSEDGIHTYVIEMPFSNSGIRYIRGYARVNGEAYPIYDTNVYKATLSSQNIEKL